MTVNLSSANLALLNNRAVNTPSALSNTNSAATLNQNAPIPNITGGRDKFTLTKNKKIALGALGGLAALGAIAFTGIMIAKKNKGWDGYIVIDEAVQQEGKTIFEKSKEVLEAAKEKFDEVTQLFKQGEEKGFEDMVVGDKTVKYGLDCFGNISMNEIVDGKTVRTTRFDFDAQDSRYVLDDIEEYIGDVINKYVAITEAGPVVKEGMIKTSDGYKINKIWSFDDNEALYFYVQDCESTDKYSKAAKKFTFNSDGSFFYETQIVRRR